jgi:activator of 2-hydroxyglutaryl-CoA dehydratase
MLVAGVDVGAATAKTAIVEDGALLSFAVMPTGDFGPGGPRRDRDRASKVRVHDG